MANRTGKKSNAAFIVMIVAIILAAAAIFAVIYTNVSTKSPFLKDAELAKYFSQYFGKSISSVTKEDLATIETINFGYSFDEETNGLYIALTLGKDGYSEESLKSDPDYDLLEELSKTYNISGVEFKSWDDLKYCTGVKNFQILGYPVFENIDFVENFASIEVLKLMQTQIADITPIAKLTTLKNLAIDYDMYEDLSFIADLVNLEELDISENQIKDISFVSGLTKLNKLVVSQNLISDITPVENLKELTHLDFSNNHDISDISAIKALPKLEKLYAGYCSIADASPVADVETLKMIFLESNQIADVTPLATLNADNLEAINLSLNEFITDWSPLDYLGDKLTGRPGVEESEEESEEESQDEAVEADADTLTEDETTDETSEEAE